MKTFFNIMKKCRVVVALAIFCLVGAKFLDVYSSLPKAYYMYNPTATQFAPSLLKMLATTSLAAGAAFVAFTITALVFGRVYCSFFCLFGILMDILRAIAKFPASNFLLKKTRFGKFCGKHFATLKYKRGRPVMRASFLALAALSVGLGYTALFGLLDPYSLYGKIMGDAVHTSAALAVNGASELLYSREIFSVPPVNGDPTVPLAAFGFALILLSAVAVASAMRGRLYCNTLCPVGAFLGFFAKFSLFQIALDKSECISCGACERNCKAQCIDSKNKRVDFSRCVLCFDCAKNCPRNAVRFSLNPTLKKLFGAKPRETELNSNQPISTSRRAFPKLALGLASVFAIAAKKECGKGAKVCKCANENPDASPYTLAGERPDKRLPSPPGSESIENFLTKCTACQMCVAACKAQILKPSLGEWGLTGFMQPFMDFAKGYCIHKCHDCSKVCPTGAIKFIKSPDKQRTKIGTAIFRKGLCVVKTDGTDCAACAEHCPVQAIEMIPFGKKEDALYIPQVHSEVCIGCGACEYICPVRPHKAIVVQGLKHHKKSAKFTEDMRFNKPVEKKSAPVKPDTNAFPF